MKIEFLETIKAIDGRFYHLEYHQKRYERTVQAYNIAQKVELESILQAPKKGLYRCRIVYDTEGNIQASYHSYVKRTIKRLKLVVADTLEYTYKFANRRDLEDLFEQRAGCDDVLIVKNALVCDTSIANIALFDDDTSMWVTPKTPLLAGTTRQRLLQEGFLREEDITIENLKKYSQLAVMNAMIDFDIIANKKIEEIIC